MTVRFHGQYLSLREVDGLSDKAFRLLMKSFFWTDANKTDGLVPAEDIALVWPGLRSPEQAAAECARRGAWHDARYQCGSEDCPAPVDADGWVIHDYFLSMPRKEDAEACEAGKSQGGKWGNHKRWHADRGIWRAGCEFCARVPGPSRRSSASESDADRISDRSSESDAESNQDFDFDFDLRSSYQSVSPQPVTDRISDQSPDIRSADTAAIARALTSLAGRPVTDQEARQVTSLICGRAARSRTPVGDITGYVIGSARRERDITRLLDAATPALREILQDSHADGHKYEHNPATGMCAQCRAPEVDKTHRVRRPA